MLRLFLVTSPLLDQVPAIAESLRAVTRPEAVSEVLSATTLEPAGSALASALGVASLPQAALGAGAGSIALVEARAARSSDPLVLVLGEEAARAVVTHALDAPVEASRLAFDPGGIAEIEVRLDSPWTVNRLNDLCHQGPVSTRGIVRT